MTVLMRQGQEKFNPEKKEENELNIIYHYHIYNNGI
jgi:hypothetical protein